MRLDKKIHLVKCDCLSLLRTLPDQSIDAIVTDPPYFKVKSASWDNQWKNEDEFFVWLEPIIFELSRVLKRNGSLYLFCSSHLQHRTEGLVNKYFKVLNHILWVKKGGKHNGCDPTSLRRYFPQTESIIFAEHCNALKRDQYVCEEVLQYLKQEWLAAGFTFKDAEKIVGSSARHYFSRSQWHMPSKEKYALLQQEAKPYLAKSYQEMLDLKLKGSKPDQKHLRAFRLVRPMDMLNRPHTNIWNFAPVQYYDGKHPCEKPVKLLEHIILTSSKENDLILDIFAGSCSTAKVALNLNRRFIGCDLDDHYFSFGITSTSKT